MGFDLRHHRLVAFFSALKQSLVLSQQYYCPKTTFIFTMPIRATLIFFPLFLFLSMPNNFEIGKWSWRKFVGSRNWTHGHLVSRPTLLTTKSPLRWPDLTDFLSGGKHWLKTIPNFFVKTHHLSTTRYKSRSKIVEDRTSCSIWNNYEGQKSGRVAEWQNDRMAEWHLSKGFNWSIRSELLWRNLGQIWVFLRISLMLSFLPGFNSKETKQR